MPEHEFVVKTLEVNWLAPIFGGVHLSGEFFINGSTRVPGKAVLSVKGNVDPNPDNTTANFLGGTPPSLNVQFDHGDINIFRDLIMTNWSGFTIFFEQSPLDPTLAEEVSVDFKRIKFYRTF